MAAKLTETQDRAWLAYLSMSERLITELHRNLLKNTGLSLPDYRVLSVLIASPQATLRAFELGTELQWEKSRLSHHLKRMESRDLIQRVVCESDGRGLWVVLTDTGREAHQSATPGHIDDVRELLFKTLTPSQTEELAVISEKVLADLSASGNLCDS